MSIIYSSISGYIECRYVRASAVVNCHFNASDFLFRSSRLLDASLGVRYNVHIIGVHYSVRNKGSYLEGEKMQTYTPTNLRKHLFDLLSRVANKDEEMEITIQQPDGPNKGVILISKERYAQLEELDFLERTGTLDVVMKRMEAEQPGDFNEDDAY